MKVIKELEANEGRLNEVRSSMPEKPGSYQFWDAEGKVIYVGKAKNLKKRVNSYFNKNQESLKTRILVSKIRKITYTTVNSEEDALNLENELIKKYKPRYNVLLKDDKSYPYIAVEKCEFPRVFKTHQHISKGATYYGPYTKYSTLSFILELIRKAYQIRTCKQNLTAEKIKEGKYKECLEYHMGNCKAPCIGKQSKKEYEEGINQIKEILKGNTRELEKEILENIQHLSSELMFEDAEKEKQKYLLLKKYNVNSEVVNLCIDNVDVFSITEDQDENSAFINYMHVKSGAVNQSFTFEFKKKIDEEKEELLLLAICEMRKQFNSNAKEIILPFIPNMHMEGINYTVPQKGEKKKLLTLSELNVKEYKLEKLKRKEKLNPEQRQTRLLKQLQELLHLKKLPKRIECFDNSNLQGSNAVSGCVVFTMGKADKKEYRKFTIRSVEGNDDFASMREVVTRKYSHTENATPLPDLIIVDGGIGQMRAIKGALKELKLEIPVAGLAKNEKHKTNELLYGEPEEIIGIKQNDILFVLLTRIQDEVHRFTINFHKQKRSKNQIKSELDEIKGIGPKSKQILLNHFKSITRIREANNDELSSVIGKNKAEIIITHFNDTER